MPIERIAFRYKREEKTLTPEELLEFAKTRPEGFPYPYEVLKVLFGEQQSRGDHLSTTALLSECPRNLVYERKEPYVEEIENLWAAFTGTMFHEQLEKAHIPGQTVVERRFWLHIEGLGWVSCKPDLVDVKYGLLDDYKSKDKLPNTHFPNPYPSHVTQLQVNRYIVQNAEYIEHDGSNGPWKVEYITPYHNRPDVKVAVQRVRDGEHRPFEFNELAIVYLAPREGMVRIPVTKSIQVPMKTKPGTKPARVADIWPDAKVEKFVREQYVTLRGALDEYDATGELPPVPEGWEGLSGWLCPYCPFKRQCVLAYMDGR